MTVPLSLLLAKLSAVITFSLLFIASSTTVLLVIEAQPQPNQTFSQCFIRQNRDSNASAKIFSPAANSSSFDSIYLSSIKNLRFFTAGSGPVKPSFVVLPTATAHVQVAVSCGKKLGLRLRVRSGGHDYEGLSYISYGDPFVLLDLSNFRSVKVNSSDGTAWVGAGATIGEVAYYISRKNGTAGFPAGICTTIGMGGHIGGGGIGTLMRKYGTSADNVVDATLIDVNGRQLNRASMGEDLFWAIRGGGAASFGVVLSYKIMLVYVPPKVTVFGITRAPQNVATQLLDKWQNVAPALGEDVWIRSVAQAIDFQGSRTIQATFQGMYNGRTVDFLSILNKSFPELGLQAQDCSEMSWVDSVLYFAGYPLQDPAKLLDRMPQSGGYFKGKSDFVRNPIDPADWESIWKTMLAANDNPLVMIMEPWGGKMYTIPDTAIAFPHRKGNLFNIQYYLYWSEKDEASATKHLNWSRSFYDFMTPYVSENPRAAYLNYRDLDFGQNQLGNTSYTEARVWGNKYYVNNFMKLAQVKARVDPGNYFWDEQSIPPYSAN